MAFARIQSEFAYRSGSGRQAYTYTILVDATGNVSVRDIRTPNGYLCHSSSSLPQPVLEDIQQAIDQTENILAQSSAVNGSETLTAEVEKVVVFTTPLSNASYRVYYETEGFVEVRTKAGSKQVSGFTLQVSTAYTGTISYDVFV